MGIRGGAAAQDPELASLTGLDAVRGARRDQHGVTNLNREGPPVQGHHPFHLGHVVKLLRDLVPVEHRAATGRYDGFRQALSLVPVRPRMHQLPDDALVLGDIGFTAA